MSISWGFVGKRCLRLSSLSLSSLSLSLCALLCGFLTVSVPASAPVYCSQLSRSCHSSAQNSPVASISLQGKAKALYGTPPHPHQQALGALTSQIPSLPTSNPQCMHTHTHAHTHIWAHTHMPAPPGTCWTLCCHGCRTSFAAFYYVLPRHLHGSHFSLLRSFLECCLLSDALSEYPLPQQSQFLIFSSFLLRAITSF